jgi:tetratricopeptide (TPR) repeat protein
MDTTHPSDIRSELRRAQQQSNLKAIDRIIDAQPELAFASDPGLAAIVAVAYAYRKQLDLTEQIIDDIEYDELPDPGAQADYALALFLTGRPSQARRILETASNNADAGFEVFGRLGAVALAQEDLSAAGDAFEQALQRAPDRAELLNNLGGVRFREGRFYDAIDFYDRALALQPALTQTQEMRAKALVALDRGEELIEDARDALTRAPERPERHLRLATVQRQAEDWTGAEATLKAAIDRFPGRDDLKASYIGLLRENQATQRLGVFLKELVEDRDEPSWLDLQLIRTRIDARFLEAAEKGLNDLANTDLVNDPAYPVLRAKILIERSQAEGAVAILEEALERFPGNAEARTLLSHTLTSLGRLEEAHAYIDEVAARNPMAIVNAVQSRDGHADDTEIGKLDRLVNDPGLAPDARARAAFTLAKARDKRKEYGAAFETLHTANGLVRRRLIYNWRYHRRLTEQQIQTIDQNVVERLRKFGWHETQRPIFIVGMPRSGTTLTEQILCSHPDVYGAGELGWVPRLRALMPKVVAGGKHYPAALTVMTESNLKSAAKYYLDRLSEQEDRSPRVVDKLPHNFDNVALIALMFPNAPIIHMDRDPRDVAVSNYFQDYAAKQGLMGFAYDLRDIGHMLNDHDRIMRHWHALFPGRIYELNYQRLVGDPEATIRDLLAFCGLSWDDRVMRFYETQRPVRTASIRQVREGIYQTSAEKWRRYEEYLGPLEEVLADGYKPLDEAEPDRRLANVIAGPTGAA